MSVLKHAELRKDFRLILRLTHKIQVFATKSKPKSCIDDFPFACAIKWLICMCLVSLTLKLG